MQGGHDAELVVKCSPTGGVVQVLVADEQLSVVRDEPHVEHQLTVLGEHATRAAPQLPVRKDGDIRGQTPPL